MSNIVAIYIFNLQGNMVERAIFSAFSTPRTANTRNGALALSSGIGMTKAKGILLAGAVLAMGSIAGAASASTNLIQDGSFEAAPSPWVTQNWGFLGNGQAPDGNTFVETTCVGVACTDPSSPGAAFVSQTITGLTAGDTYLLSFLYDPDINLSPPRGTNELLVQWGGASVIDLVNVAAGGFTLYSANVTASGPSEVLTFFGRQDPSALGLDNVSLTATTGGVPEPALWALMIAGFGLTGGALRRRRSVTTMA